MKDYYWRTTRAVLLLGVVVAGLGGCYGGSSSNHDSSSGGATTTGSQSCQEWQRAICDWVDQCGGDGATCREQAAAIACLSDSEAGRCASEFDASGCSTLPAACNLSDIADPAPAVAACNDLVETVCALSEQCQAGTHDSCVTQTATSLDCSQALGVMPEYEQCKSELSALTCDATQGPASCMGVILLAQ